MEEIFLPEFHPHNLERKISNNRYECDGCREPGFGLRSFRCKQCNFDLHDECAHVIQTTTHDLYKNNIFNFFRKPPDHSIVCAMCGLSVYGFVYYCENLKKYLHPCCHSLPSKFKFYHLEFTLRDKILSSTCLWCSNDSYFPIEGLSYMSKCNKYNFHVSCAKEMIIKKYYVGVHLGNSFEKSLQGCLEIHLGGILKRQRRRKIVMSFVITNLVLELSSAVLDQVSSSSSVNKIQFALFGMSISFVAMLTCILELIFEFRKENLIWRRSNALPFPWYYYRDQGRKPFGTFKDIVGLVCALCPCLTNVDFISIALISLPCSQTSQTTILITRIEIDNVELRLRDGMPSMCLWCNKPRPIPCMDFSYQSKCNKYTFHVNCATQMMLQESKKRVDMGNSLKQSIQRHLEKTKEEENSDEVCNRQPCLRAFNGSS
ncbi:hypothetical protein QYF36_016602 [Acer negundo]|nr:hypothetical protein QYF36_016602 [Acer negundo]